jgi:outer membrane protein OmpA-like peptidoglycan-associated protein/tetratricopeptide (TPR) repeat protein
MKYVLHFIALIVLLIPHDLTAQTEVKVRKGDFKKEREGFREAWKHIEAGDKYFLGGGVWYGNAYEEYLRATAYNGENAELNYKTGAAALFSNNKDEAAGFLLKAFELKKNITGDILLLTGRALQYAGRYQEAREKLNSYLESGPRKKKDIIALVNKYIEQCNSADSVTSDTLRVDLMNLGSAINSDADDYSEVVTRDNKTIYFASRRQLSKASTNYDDTRYDENIFLSSSLNGKWEPAVTAGKQITTPLCEAPLYINPTGEEMYIYTGYENGGDIKLSMKKKGVWKAPVPVPFKINTGGSESSFTFSPSGMEVWFVTNKGKDGLGGKDIYFAKKLNNRKWSKPVNAGPMINTPYDEESVRLSERGDTLWFGSRGHDSMGGYDIFYSVKDQSGAWSKAVNRGYPVNTVWDDLFYHPSWGDDSTFYFVSNRSGGMGGLDIYQGRLLPPEPVIIPEPPKPDTVVVRDTIVVVKEVTPTPPPVVVPEPPKMPELFLGGKISDSETGDPVMAKIDIIDLSTDLVVGTTASSDVDGTYRIKLPAKKSYMVDLRASGFLSDMKQINIPDSFTGEVYSLNASLIKVKVGKKVVLNNILFQTGKSILTTGSYSELDRLLGILNDNPQMKIEISGHTDNTGSFQLNLKLSEDRAKAVVEYLAQKGIDRTRLQYKGYGPQQPIADNATADGRTKNRRVEFKILEF